MKRVTKEAREEAEGPSSALYHRHILRGLTIHLVHPLNHLLIKVEEA
jgi:hypothetical protein